MLENPPTIKDEMYLVTKSTSNLPSSWKQLLEARIQTTSTEATEETNEALTIVLRPIKSLCPLKNPLLGYIQP